MRENYRKSIASIEKLPQFTTMNVIDGQAGIIICSRLIFYSLTIDNILNIIVLLILAGVSIATLTGENGILSKASAAKEKNSEAVAEEKIKIEVMNSYDNQGIFNLSTLKDNIEKAGGNTDGNTEPMKVKIDDYEVMIDANGKILEPGVYNRTYTTSNSIENIKFINTITKSDIENFTGKKDVDYEIVGVSDDKNGEYKKEGTVEGKSGKLEIIGNISDTTFEYKLTDFMQGDEKFYLKILVEREEIVQELTIKQGDIMTYEEDFVGINYTEGTWTVDENENYNNGIAKMTDTIDAYSIFKFNYTGTGVGILSRTNSETGYLIINSGEYRTNTKTDNQEEYFNFNILKDKYKNLESGQHSINIEIAKSNKVISRNRYFYLDAIKIYR